MPIKLNRIWHWNSNLNEENRVERRPIFSIHQQLRRMLHQALNEKINAPRHIEIV